MIEHTGIRPATTGDLNGINAIFNQYVKNSTCVWRNDLCSDEEREG